MTERHVTSADLELYVLGALDSGRSEALEAHAASCARCAAGLAREARLEVAFERVANRAAGARMARPLRAIVCGGAGLIAAAAVVALWAGRAPSSAAAGAEGTAAASHAPGGDGAIFDARNDALDGG